MQSVLHKLWLYRIPVVNIILVVNALCWYLHLFSFLKNNSVFVGTDLVLIVGFNLLAVSLSAILSSKLIQKVKNRLKFLMYWMIIGAFLSPLYILIGNNSFLCVAFLGCIFGIYFGIGSPVLMGYYSGSTEDTHRGKISGLTIFLTFTCIIAFGLADLSALQLAIIMTAWKLCGVFAVVLLKPPDFEFSEKEPVSYKSVLTSRPMLLYFIPWLMFSIVNNFAFPVLYVIFPIGLVNLVSMVELLLAGVLAIVFGSLADRLGRKRLIFFGFVMLGLGYAILSLLPDYNSGLYFYTVADSIAWGIFSPLFLLTIWGDMAEKKNCEKFFAIGFLPYILSNFLQVVFGHYVANSITNFTVVFSFASFFLFITVVPLYLAPETMSEEERKDKELQRYISKAKRMTEKAVKPSNK